MALSDDYLTGIITGMLVNASGEPARGAVRFVPETPRGVLFPPNAIILPDPVSATVQPDGSFSKELISGATPGFNPQGFGYRVEFRLVGVQRDPMHIYVEPGTTKDLSELAGLTYELGREVILVTKGPKGDKGDPGDTVQVPRSGVAWTGHGPPGTIVGSSVGDSYLDLDTYTIYSLGA